jgi:flagellar motor switch protein FliN/FliY
MAEQDPKPTQDETPEQQQPDAAAPDSAPDGAESAEAAATEALEAAEQAVAELNDPADEDTAAPFTMQSFEGGLNAEDVGGIDLLSDVNLNVKIELGRTAMLVEDVLRLGEGSVVELDKLAGDPVDIFVNDRPVARGEVLVLNDSFCVRINEILAPPGGVAETGEDAAA